MSYQPMPLRSDVTSVLSLAQAVADDFSRAPAVFSSGERAATELIAELIAYQQLSSSRENSHPNNQSNFDSSLTANLQPCRDVLKNMLDTRQKYGRDAKLGLMESVRWARDEKRFEQEVATLRQDTARLRELVRELQRSASATLTNQRQVQEEYQPNRGGAFGAPVLQTTVSIAGAQYTSHPASAQTQRTISTPSFASQNSFTSQTPTPTEMCPNGSGCRRPRCHLDYLHPNAPKCENGKDCGARNCEKWHPKSAHCPKGPSCPAVGCVKAHPWPREPASPPISYLPSESSFTLTTGSVPAQPGGLVVVTATLSTLGNGNQSNPNHGNMGSNQGWCRLRFQCPGGYNGACPLRHPRRAACRDIVEQGHCPKGASCSYDHSPETVAQARAKEQGVPQYIAELPARRY